MWMAHTGDPVSSADLWREQQRLARSVMRDLGMGRNATERRIQIEAKCLEEELRAVVGQKIVPYNMILTRAVSNIIYQFVFGFRSSPEDYEFQTFHQTLKKIFQDGSFSVFVPLLVQALENTFISKYFTKDFAENEKKCTCIAFIEDKVVQFEAQMINMDNGEPQYFVEAFLKRQQSGITDRSFCRPQLVFSVYDLFPAGSETISTFLNWAFIYLSVHRD